MTPDQASARFPFAVTQAPAWMFLAAIVLGDRIEGVDIDWHGGTQTIVEAHCFRGAVYITDIRIEPLPMLTPATTAQLEKLTRLLRRAEYDMRTITIMHRRLDLPDHLVGQSVSAWLSSLNSLQASDLINKLEKQLA